MNEIVQQGFVCTDPMPYRLVRYESYRYKRVLKKEILPKDFLLRNRELLDADIEFKNNNFQLYYNVIDGIDIVEKKHYLSDRIIFQIK